MKAVIMAGGQGTRLRPLTSNAPKPMMPLGNRPMMEHVVHHLARHGFDDIVVTIAFMGNAIRNYFGDGSEFGVRMSYAVEDTPLGTAGSVRNAMDKLDERFLVISGDVLSDLDLGTVVETHVAAQAMATIGLIAVDNPLEFGIVITREDGSIERFLGILIENSGGDFPFWLAPVHARVLPIADRHAGYAGEVAAALEAGGLRVEVDGRSESVGRRIRDGELAKLPYLLIVGDDEEGAGAASVRARHGEDEGASSVAEVVSRLSDRLGEHG